MAIPRILVVEDEPGVRQMLRLLLEQNDMDVLEAADAAHAESSIAKEPPSLILLDWMLPGTSGVELARKLKRESLTRAIPIIMLTARGEEDDKVRGLECGADDYVTKPFSTRELLARIKALLRRAAPLDSNERIQLGGLCLEPASHRVSANDQSIELGPTEFRLLHFFMTHPERIYSRAQLLDQVWGTNVFIEERTVDVHIRRLRKALEPSGCEHLLQTVRGAGYRFSSKVGD